MRESFYNEWFRDKICKKNWMFLHRASTGCITDVRLNQSMKEIYEKSGKVIEHVALTIEGKRPKFQPSIEKMRVNIAKTMELEFSQVGITATSGDGLTDFGCGDGLQCFCILTTIEY